MALFSACRPCGSGLDYITNEQIGVFPIVEYTCGYEENLTLLPGSHLVHVKLGVSKIVTASHKNHFP